MNTITGYDNPQNVNNGHSNNPVYGAGNAQYKNLISNQATQLGNIQSGYQGLQNNLDQQKAGDNINLDSFYSNLAQQRAAARQALLQQQPGVGDILGLGASAASLFI
jgi:hypothetical protein